VNHAHVRETVNVDPTHFHPIRTVAADELIKVIDLLLGKFAGP